MIKKDTNFIAKAKLGRFPAMAFLNQDDIKKAVRLLEADEYTATHLDIMHDFITYFKNQ